MFSRRWRAILAASLLLNGLFVALLAYRLARRDPPRTDTYAPLRDSLFEELPIPRGSVVMLGASIVDRGEWQELLDAPHVVNRGVSGATSADALQRLAPILDSHPAKVVVMVGFNDFDAGATIEEVFDNHQRMVKLTVDRSPDTELWLLGVLPQQPAFYRGPADNKAIHGLNRRLEALCADEPCRYLDVTAALVDDDGALARRWTLDGVHLSGPAYRAWSQLLASEVL